MKQTKTRKKISVILALTLCLLLLSSLLPLPVAADAPVSATIVYESIYAPLNADMVYINLGTQWADTVNGNYASLEFPSQMTAYGLSPAFQTALYEKVLVTLDGVTKNLPDWRAAALAASGDTLGFAGLNFEEKYDGTIYFILAFSGDGLAALGFDWTTDLMKIQLADGFVTPFSDLPVAAFNYQRTPGAFTTDNSAPSWSVVAADPTTPPAPSVTSAIVYEDLAMGGGRTQVYLNLNSQWADTVNSDYASLEFGGQRTLYGLSPAFSTALDEKILITLNGVTKTMPVWREEALAASGGEAGLASLNFGKKWDGTIYFILSFHTVGLTALGFDWATDVMDISLIDGFVTPYNDLGVIPVKFRRAATAFTDANSAPPWTVVTAEEPTATPTIAATPTTAPTEDPSATPTTVPTAAPTATPTAVPTAAPTTAPTTAPTPEPTSSADPVSASVVYEDIQMNGARNQVFIKIISEWADMSNFYYVSLEFESQRDLYELSPVFRAALDEKVLVTLDGVTKTLPAWREDALAASGGEAGLATINMDMVWDGYIYFTLSFQTIGLEALGFDWATDVMEIEFLDGFITPYDLVPVIPVKFVRSAVAFADANSTPPWTSIGGVLPTPTLEATVTAAPTSAGEATPTSIPDDESPATSDVYGMMLIMSVLSAGAIGVASKRKFK